MVAPFAVVEHPYSLRGWEQATGIRADFCSMFEAWSHQRVLTDQLAEARDLGHREVMVTWEPWDPTGDAHHQPAYALDSITRGAHDSYIDAFARSLRDSDLTVYLRFGHEFNGDWYPWAGDPERFKAAWIYLRDRVRFARKATNVRWMWAPNADLWASHVRFLVGTVDYWPPDRYVDDVGLTLIQRATSGYTLSQLAQRVNVACLVFGRVDVWAAEVKSALGPAVEWFDALTSLSRTGRLAGVVLNQSGGGVPDPVMDWSVRDHRVERAAVARLAEAVRVAPPLLGMS